MIVVCQICSEELVGNDEVVTIQCGHVFHESCLSHFIDYSDTCPNCSRPVSRSNIIKLCLNVGSTDEESQVDSLKAKLMASKNNIKKLQLHATGIEKAKNKLQRKVLKLSKALDKERKKVNSLSIVEAKLQRMNEDLGRLNNTLFQSRC